MTYANDKRRFWRAAVALLTLALTLSAFGAGCCAHGKSVPQLPSTPSWIKVPIGQHAYPTLVPAHTRLTDAEYADAVRLQGWRDAVLSGK